MDYPSIARRTQFTCRDAILGVMLFTAFASLYWFCRLPELTLDGGHTAMAVSRDLLANRIAAGGGRHELTHVVQVLWARLLPPARLDPLLQSPPELAVVAHALDASTSLNGLAMAAIIVALYFYLRTFDVDRLLASALSILFGVSSGVWLIATVAELQPLGVFVLVTTLLVGRWAPAGAILSGFRSAALASLAALSTLLYLPLLALVPAVFLLDLAGAARNSTVATVRQVKFAAGIRIVVWAAIFEIVARALTASSASGKLLIAVREAIFFTRPESWDGYQLLSPTVLANKVLLVLSFFTNWLAYCSTGVFDRWALTRFGGWSMAGYLVSALILAAAAVILALAIRRAMAAFRTGVVHETDLILSAFLLWVVLGASVLLFTVQGLFIEFWWYSLMALVPICALVIPHNWQNRTGRVVLISSAAVLTINFLTGRIYFEQTFATRNSAFLEFTGASWTIMRAAGENGIVVGRANGPLSFLAEMSTQPPRVIDPVTTGADEFQREVKSQLASRRQVLLDRETLNAAMSENGRSRAGYFPQNAEWLVHRLKPTQETIGNSQLTIVVLIPRP